MMETVLVLEVFISDDAILRRIVLVISAVTADVFVVR